jgi:hypothetical protein
MLGSGNILASWASHDLVLTLRSRGDGSISGLPHKIEICFPHSNFFFVDAR